MTSRPSAPRTELHRDLVGTVRLGLDDELVVAVVRRRWAAAEPLAHAGSRVAATHAPAAVEVRRTDLSEPGAMTTASARRLTELLGEAVELAAVFDASAKGAGHG